jgi:hypothetical protein
LSAPPDFSSRRSDRKSLVQTHEQYWQRRGSSELGKGNAWVCFFSHPFFGPWNHGLCRFFWLFSFESCWCLYTVFPLLSSSKILGQADPLLEDCAFLLSIGNSVGKALCVNQWLPYPALRMACFFSSQEARHMASKYVLLKQNGNRVVSTHFTLHRGDSNLW